MARSRRLRRRVRGAEGFTLVELIVAMGLFAVVLSLIASATVVMARSLNKQQGQSDNLDASRKVVDLLDRQVRYANAINTPANNASGTATYVEWQTGDTSQPQTCTQWRFDKTAATLGYRTWDAATMIPTGWRTQALGVMAIGATPVFASTAGGTALVAATPTPAPSPAVTAHTQLTISFALVHGNPSTTTKNQLTLTGINTGAAATPAGICAGLATGQGALRP